ncbi:MAG: FAD-dependent oxidoreductase [Kribbellaceae bacterium]|nr:FAD-dependent oxidoreductase [Catenulispora sp.]NUR98535.1 FAD-dependent oxidoreductase [Kribbellaceae bacterium]
MTASVAIIGGGQGGATLAQALRQRGFAGHVTLVCAEDTLPYERPPLSKGILAGDDPTLVVPAEFYPDNDIDVMRGHRATEIRHHASGLEVVLDAAPSVFADRVVLATGSQPRELRIPGADLWNVLSLSTIGQSRHLHSQLPDLEQVVIAGAGFVGTEVAAALRSKGCDVVLVEPSPQPLVKSLGTWAAGVVRELHEAAGVRFVEDVIAAAEGRGRVERVVTGRGEVLRCDLLLVAVGSQANLDVATRSGLTCTDGVVCDELGRTSMPGVSAIGDVAVWPYGALGRLRVEHFRTAIDHAEIVAGDIVGAPTAKSLVPWFWTDQYQTRIEVAGRPDQGTVHIGRRGPDGRLHLTLHLRDDRVVGAIGIDCPREVRAASQLIRTQGVVDPGALCDPSIDLRKAAIPA